MGIRRAREIRCNGGECIRGGAALRLNDWVIVVCEEGLVLSGFVRC